MRRSTRRLTFARISSSSFLALQLLDRLLEKLHVHVEADGLDVPALFAAEQVSGAANLEVESRDAEPAAEIAELPDRRQPFLGDGRERILRGNEQVGVGPAIRSADPPAQLIELRQTVTVRSIDDDGVRVRDVEPVLDDRRRQQDVVLVADELHHHALELVLAHLAVRDADPRLRHQPGDQVAERIDRLDAVVDEVHLAAALDLGADGPRDDRLVELDDVGLNRQAILRRRLDDRHVADAGERHVQGPRDRRGRHGQHVHAFADLLDPFLVCHAEPLLLVDDEEAEILELHVLRQQAMRADDDFNLPGDDVVDDLLLLRFAPEAAEHVDRGRGRRQSDP